METTREQKRFVVYIALLPLAGTALASAWHFLYDLIPSPVIGAVAPVNESLWEHLKIVYYPFLILWCAGYAFLRARENAAGYALAGAVGAGAAAVSVVMFDFLFVDIFGVPSVLPLHIINCAVAFIAGAVSGYPFMNIGDRKAEIALSVYAAVVTAACIGGILFTSFTA